MAAVAPPADQAAGLLQKLSLDSQTKKIETPEPAEKASVDNSNAANGNRSVTPLLSDFVDPALCYLPSGYPPSAAYFYGGYDGSANEWEEYPRYVNQDGVDVTPGVYGENGSLLYHPGYGYASYAPPYSPATSPVPTLGPDGQLYGAQHYQYPTPFFQSPTPSGPYPTPPAPVKGDSVTSGTADQAPLSVDSAKSKPNGVGSNITAKGNGSTVSARTTNQNLSFNGNASYGRGGLPGGISASGYLDPRYGFDGLQTPIPWLESAYFADGQSTSLTNSSMTSSGANVNGGTSSRNHNYRPHSTGLHHPSQLSGMSTDGYMNRMYPNKIYGHYGNAYRSSMGYGSYGYGSRLNGRGWMAVDNKFRPKGRGNGLYNYGEENMDGLNELNRGPRAKSTKNQKGFTPVALAVKGQNIPFTVATDNNKKSSVTPDREQYNRPEFSDSYADAKFFIIKSYSEDDVHKSIKYNVWSSTPNGNKKLDAAYLDAQQKPGGCPIFLLFSVNTSGQFVGVGEMSGSVDFDKNVEYWQQDKWVGYFPVKWHIVKDVPNSLLKHITLENNENKPVTNSRDTQEVKLEQGLQLLKIFKDHISKQSILDDFDFYEEREKRIREKKAKQQQYQKHARAWEGKRTEDKTKESTNADDKPQESSEVASELKEQFTAPVQCNGDRQATEKVALAKGGDVLKTLKQVTVPEKLVGNAVANGC